MLQRYNGFLPAPNARWCTRELKIKPMEAWVNGDECYSYIGIRADEPTREGCISRAAKNNITAVYPYREDGITITDVYRILEESVGLPRYYLWRTRSGCYFCFYQRRVEWAIMYPLYPDWFVKAKVYESEHEDGRQFTWVKDKPLDYVEQNAHSIIARYIRKQSKKLADCTRLTYQPDDMIDMVMNGHILDVVESGDIKILHDVDGENKDGCTVCAI